MSEKPLTRMMLYIGTKLETLERCYGHQEDDGTYTWPTEMAKYEHDTLTEIHKTLELVTRFEPEFKQILKRNLGAKKPNKK